MRHWWICALFVSSWGSLPAATVTRGPYLQKGTATNVVVRWRTNIETDSRVRLGTSPGNFSQTFEDPQSTTEHKVKLIGLSPNTRYYYSFGSFAETLGSGPDHFFVTSPATNKSTRIWVLGDSGTKDESAAWVRDSYYAFTGQRHTDLWLMLGDNAYQTGTDEDYTEAVFDMYPEMLRKSVLWPTIGNHDTYSDPDNPPYLSIFSLPTEGQAGGVASGTERYYSFDYGNIHFICLDSMNENTSRQGPMATWLEQDLTANTNQWLIAFWHHPPYSKGSHDSDAETDLARMRQNFLPILESFDVDLVLCGHSHSYERSFLMHGHYGSSSELDSEPWLIVDRTSGRSGGTGPYVKDPIFSTNGTVYAVAGSSGQTSGGELDHPAMFISLNELGSMVVDIDGNTLDAIFLQAGGAITDHFTILKDKPDDLFRITSFRLHQNFVTLSWNSVIGQTYYVAFSPTLDPPNWQPASGGIPAQGKKTSWTGFLPANTRGFFQIARL